MQLDLDFDKVSASSRFERETADAAQSGSPAAVFHDHAIHDQVRNGLHRLGMVMSDCQIRRCISHLALVAHWNRGMNLTSIRAPRDFVSHHLLDSLAGVAALTATLQCQSGAFDPSGLRRRAALRIIDLGSGAGFPGIPLALVWRAAHVTLIDSSLRKTQFLTHAVAQLQLHNVAVLHARIQDIKIAEPYDIATARGLGSVRAVAQLAQPLLRGDGCAALLKGRNPSQELQQLNSVWHAAVQRLQVPSLSAQRHLVVLRRNASKDEWE